MNDTSEQNRQHYFEKVNSLLKNTCHTDKMRGRLKCIKGHIVFFHILFFCKNTASYLREYLVFKAIILNKLNLSKKKCHTKKMRRKLSFIKGCIVFLQEYVFFFFLGSILSSRQMVTCKQHFPLTMGEYWGWILSLEKTVSSGLLRSLAVTCSSGHLRSLALAVTCGHLWSLAATVTCGHLLQQSLAVTCGHSSDCK